MLRLDAKFGEILGFRPSFLLGALSGNRHVAIMLEALPVGLKPRHVLQFRECRLTDVGKSVLTEKSRNMRKT